MTDAEDRRLRAQVRVQMFRHLDGFGIGSTVAALEEKGILELFRQQRGLSLDAIARHTPCNLGYVNVGLRLLACQGWLVRRDLTDSLEYHLTSAGENAFALASRFTLPCQFLARHPIVIEMEDLVALHKDSHLLEDFQIIAESLQNNWSLPLLNAETDSTVAEQMHQHLDGLIVAPVMVMLHRIGLLEAFLASGRLEIRELGDYDLFGELLMNIFEHLGWMQKVDDDYIELTPSGRFAAEKVHTYGVTVSYLPTLIRVPDLFYADAKSFSHASSDDGQEKHVDRKVNVWASGASHRAYFAKMEPMLLEIFNQPLHQQPQGVAEMGCGDGTMLCFIYDVIHNKTLRGKHLDTHPLIIVGSDFNQAAREVAAVHFQQHGMPHHLLYGDINDPQSFAQELERLYGRKLVDFVSVRAFIDHERNYATVPTSGRQWSHPTHAAFADQGALISTPALMDNLVEHLSKWWAYANKHGLMVIELHTLDPVLASQHLGQTLVTPYDAIHGYTDQYPVELASFNEAAEVAGFKVDARFTALFPPNELATISVQWLRPITGGNGLSVP